LAGVYSARILKGKNSADLPPRASAGEAEGGRDGAVRFTHPDRVYSADIGVTKRNLADYYRVVWP
jgi:bifunctional non-homologous end joining protein LigD